MSPDFAAALYDDLRANVLEVVLVPSRVREEAERGGMIRCVVGSNPAWYSRLCTAHQKRRIRRSYKPDTRVVRRDLVRLLDRASRRLPTKSYLLDWIDANVTAEDVMP